MSDSNFSSLIYRIIGKPERWHDDYIVEMMQQYLDQADAVDDPLNLLELAAGEQILSRLSQGNVAINAFNSLLDKSRFQMIILDDQFTPLYHNTIANNLYKYIQNPNKPNSLKIELLEQIKKVPDSQELNHLNAMHALDFYAESGAQLYVRTIQSQVTGGGQSTVFHILMSLNKSDAHLKLNPDLAARYGLTEKEQEIIWHLVHGDSIKDIAAKCFVTENTVRSHLKSIFRKTDSNSQGALISLMLTHESQVLDSYFDSSITTISSDQSSHADQQITLSNGQQITYCEYGPKDGFPIIVFHSGFGSRLAVPLDYEQACLRHNKRLIIPDRPGLGRTPFKQGHPDGWSDSLNEMIELLGIEEYHVIGSIIACQMAMQFASQADSRLSKLILTSPVFLNDDSDTEYLTEILAPAAKYVKLSPEFAREIYALWLKAVTLNLDAHYPAILEESIGNAEKEQFQRDGTIQLLTNVFKEGARQSLDGILNEMVYCMTPLHLELEKITVPVELWYGTEDKRITQAGIETIFNGLPNCTLHIKEGYSEHIYYSLFDEIIA